MVAARSPHVAVIGAAALVVFMALVALGTWQVHRLAWKLALIARTDAKGACPGTRASARAGRLGRR